MQTLYQADAAVDQGQAAKKMNKKITTLGVIFLNENVSEQLK